MGGSHTQDFWSEDCLLDMSSDPVKQSFFSVQETIHVTWQRLVLFELALE